MKICKLSDIARFTTGKLNSNAATMKGRYPFFTCAPKPLTIDTYAYDTKAVILAGNNAEGNFHIQYYEGKFNAYQRTYIIETNDETIVDIRYLYYALKICLLHFKQISQGTATKFLTAKILNAFELPIPRIEEQQKIAFLLAEIDEKIKTNEIINNNLEQQAKTLFKSWFVDFEPFDESFVDSPIGTKIPHSLQMVQIGSLSHILETGKRPKGGAVATGVPSIGAENVKRLGEVNFASAKYIPVEFAQKMDKGKVHGYELMLYKDGGKPGTFIPHFSMFGEGFPYDDFYINEHVFKLDFGDKGFNEFCYFYLQTDYPYNWLANNGGKAAVPGINQQDVNSIWIYHPDNPCLLYTSDAADD